MRSSELRNSDYKLRHAKTPVETVAPGRPMSRSAISKTTFAEIAERFAPELQSEESDESGLPVPTAGSAPPAEMRRPGLPLKAVIAAVIGGALVPTTILFALLWQGTMNTSNDGAGGLSVASTLNSGGATSPEIALSSPERIEVKAGEQIDFPLAIDATEKLPSRSVVAVSAMPDGASFSSLQPHPAHTTAHSRWARQGRSGRVGGDYPPCRHARAARAGIGNGEGGGKGSKVPSRRAG